VITFLTVLSVVAALALLGVLLVGLHVVVKHLQSIRGWFEKITVGIRALEHQTKDLGASATVLTGSLREVIDALDGTSQRRPDRRG
jgi:uncharacterized protein YoxC